MILAWIAAVLALSSSPISGWQRSPGTIQSPFDEVQERLQSKATAVNMEATVLNKEAEQPRKLPEEKPTSASASTGTPTSLVNGTSFPELLGLAVDQGLMSSENGATTVNFDLFGFTANIQSSRGDGARAAQPKKCEASDRRDRRP
ncbi:MAG TPA: hypothetical protein VLX28_13115 [Thermoanaerobaculia bacterium]|nr:hypothetical protein [Thermoanaerobaculia bacterium]